MTRTIVGDGPDAVLLANMGGPQALGDVRPFLREIFLDPAIIGAPAFVRVPLAHAISTLRAPIARRRYRKIGGRSPLADALSAQARALARVLRDRGRAVRVAWGMRYGTPWIAHVLDDLAAPGLERLVLVPLFPQYSVTTTATVVDLVRAWWDAKGLEP
ncbi:MAG: ferrochelatase, partial [Planctomycetes bacterium]|nr:ferrochelatase [Planctomycetota bacterium]